MPDGKGFHRLAVAEEAAPCHTEEEEDRTRDKLKAAAAGALPTAPATAVDVREEGDAVAESSELVRWTPMTGWTLQRIVKSISYGVMNVVVGVPAMVAFSSIIFRDPQFHDAEYFPQLVKLVLFSGFVHQCVFSATSSLRFAVGQVQDAGLIFLSSMATQVVHHPSFPSDTQFTDKLPTVLISLSLSTALLGVALVITGRLQLASYVQYLPLPVIGGYMAFIGMFCGEAGLSLMLPRGETIDGLLSVTKAYSQWRFLLTLDSARHLLPGVVLGIALICIVTRFRHFLVLPGCMLAIPCGFYVVQTIGGWELEELRDDGWLAELTAQPPWCVTRAVSSSSLHTAAWGGMLLPIAAHPETRMPNKGWVVVVAGTRHGPSLTSPGCAGGCCPRCCRPGWACTSSCPSDRAWTWLRSSWIWGAGSTSTTSCRPWGSPTFCQACPVVSRARTSSRSPSSHTAPRRTRGCPASRCSSSRAPFSSPRST